MKKLWTLIILFLSYSCHSDVIEFDRTYQLSNALNLNIKIQTFGFNEKLTRTFEIEGSGVILEETKLAVDGLIDPAYILGEKISVIFNDSLIITHKTGFLDTTDFNPPNASINILHNESWTRISNELYTYEINEELLSQAVPLED